MRVALYCPWEGDEDDEMGQLLACILGPVYGIAAVVARIAEGGE